MSSEQMKVWVFCGPKSAFPSGVFHSQDEAEAWIAKHRLTGTLTEYPVGIGVYEWAIEGGHFTPRKPEHFAAKFIQGFSSASQTHHHYDHEG